MAGAGGSVPLGTGFSQMDWAKKNNSLVLQKKSNQVKQLTMADVFLLGNGRDMAVYMVYKGKVYDVRSYLAYHPGGIKELYRAAGDDSTPFVAEIHPWVNVPSMLKGCEIGVVVPSSLDIPWKNCTLVQRIQISSSPNCFLLKISQKKISSEVQDEEDIDASAAANGISSISVSESSDLSKSNIKESITTEKTWMTELSCLRHVKIRAVVKGRAIERPYTPINFLGSQNRNDDIHLLVKTYAKPSIAKYLCEGIALGEKLEVMWRPSPVQFLQLQETKQIKVKIFGGDGRQDGVVEKMGFIVGGTAITPVLQILNWLNAIPNRNESLLRIWIVWCNKGDEKETVLPYKAELEGLCKEVGLIEKLTFITTKGLSFDAEDEDKPSVLRKWLESGMLFASDDSTTSRILYSGPWGFEDSLRNNLIQQLGFMPWQLIHF